MYAKVFSQIFDSSIADDYKLRHFFMDLLVLADINGVVDMTPTAIAGRTRIPLEEVKGYLTALEKPDSESRTPEHEGRRIVRLDEHRTWGWCILNYHKFRAIASEEQRREKTKLRTKKWREAQQKEVSDAPVTHGDAGDAMQRQRQKQRHLAGESAGAPSLNEVLVTAQMIGLSEWKARDWFDEMEGCGWLDFQHRPVVRWQSVLNRVKVKWEADGRPASPPSQKQPVAGGRSLTPLDLRTIIAAKETRCSALKAKHCAEGPLTNDWNDAAARNEFYEVRREIKALNIQLSKMA